MCTAQDDEFWELACKAADAADAKQQQQQSQHSQHSQQQRRRAETQAQAQALPAAGAAHGSGGRPVAPQLPGAGGGAADGGGQSGTGAAALAAGCASAASVSSTPIPLLQVLRRGAAAEAARAKAAVAARAKDRSPRKRSGAGDGGAGGGGSSTKRPRTIQDCFKAKQGSAVARAADEDALNAASRMAPGGGGEGGAGVEPPGKQPFKKRTMRGAPVTGPHFAFEQVAGDKQVLETMAKCLKVPHAELSARFSATQCMQRRRAYFTTFPNDSYVAMQTFNREVLNNEMLRDDQLPVAFESLLGSQLCGQSLPPWYTEDPGVRKKGCLPLVCCATKLIDNKTLNKINKALLTERYEEGHQQAGQRMHPRDIEIEHGKSKNTALDLIKKFGLVPVPVGGSRSKWKVRNLLPSELDTLFGFGGHLLDLNQTVARALVGRTWVVDQAMYALSPLRDMVDDDWVARGFTRGSTNDGLIVWSLFDGIGAGPLALENLDVRIAKLFTSEIEANACAHVRTRYAAKMSATQSTQGDAAVTEFYELGSIVGEKWSTAGVERLIEDHGRPHIILAGPPCNQISSLNRGPASREAGRCGLEGTQSRLAYRAFEVLKQAQGHFDVESDGRADPTQYYPLPADPSPPGQPETPSRLEELWKVERGLLIEESEDGYKLVQSLWPQGDEGDEGEASSDDDDDWIEHRSEETAK